VDPYKEQANLIKAMGHPTRLRILEILSHGEACVCHLTTVLDSRQPYVSQLLMSLREAGLVRDRRDGIMVYYQLGDARISEVIHLTREVLMLDGEERRFHQAVTPPVDGCPCPKCEAARAKAA